MLKNEQAETVGLVFLLSPGLVPPLKTLRNKFVIDVPENDSDLNRLASDFDNEASVQALSWFRRFLTVLNPNSTGFTCGVYVGVNFKLIDFDSAGSATMGRPFSVTLRHVHAGGR